MNYQSELTFVQKLFGKLGVNTHIISLAENHKPELPYELEYLIYEINDSNEALQDSLKRINSNTIYRVLNEYNCNYIILRLPEQSEESYLIIGPYLQEPITNVMMLEWVEKFSISPSLYIQLEQFYMNLPLIPDDSNVVAIINVLGEVIWNGKNQFSLQYIDQTSKVKNDSYNSYIGLEELDDPILMIRTLEERYSTENEMMRSVSQGIPHTRTMLTRANAHYGIQQRLPDSVRNLKNYMIILNTVLRKAAEDGCVHPLHIDRLSTKFAREIELINSPDNCFELEQKMISQYALLVKNHNMKGFSFLVSQVIAYIDINLATDLSLKAHAERLNVNASYLSTLFKKETGKTLTDYVNRKRIDYAIILLNSTTMQVQTIAQYCGILDVNYFTKIFKKYTGKTPKQYRDDFLEA